MPNIEEFKAALLGGGARANQFRVTITGPTGINIGLDVARTSFLVSAANLPAMSLPEIAIPFRGRSIYIAGDREFADTWTTTFYNDTDFMIRNAMERWSNGINDLAMGTGVGNPADYQTDLLCEHLDRDDKVLKSYIFKSAWPTGVTEIALTSESAAAIETFDVTWRYQWYETSAVNY
jgi:hypothetical protein